MKISEQLKDAKALISDPWRWTQQVPARDEFGCNVPFDSESACKFCSIGAVWKSQRLHFGTGAKDGTWRTWLDMAAGMGIAEYNDTHTHEEVMAAWDKAIALAEYHECGEYE